MALRWCASGMIEAGKQFRCVNGHLQLKALREAIDRVEMHQDGTGDDAVRHPV